MPLLPMPPRICMLKKDTNFRRIPLERARLRRNLGYVQRSFWCARFVEYDDADVGRVGSLVIS